MKRILSTKILSIPQKERLLLAGISLVEYDAIKIEKIPFSIKNPIENAIVTSQNTAARLSHFKSKIFNVFCVGDKTASLLEASGFNIVVKASNAKDLATAICEDHKEKSFTFFCGNLRRNELPQLLKKNNLTFAEKIVYKTHLNTKKLAGNFDGILFFSPSGVASYFSENKAKHEIAYCIGATTAREVFKYTEKYIVANIPTIENVLVQVIKSLGSNKIDYKQ